MAREVSVLFKAVDAVSNVAKSVAGKVRDLGNEAKTLLENRLIQGIGFAGMVKGLQASWQAADEFEASMRRLDATARLTGVPLEQLQAIAQRGRDDFKLSATQANDFAIELAKVAAKAGDVGQAGPALQAFLDIGAARGLSASETLQAVKQSILGIDEGTDKLFSKNPSVLYEEYAAKIGTTAGKLDDQQKAQALLTAALEDGSKVQGEYGSYLQSNAGRTEQMKNATEEAAVQLGQATASIRALMLPALVTLAEGFQSFIGGLQLLAVDAAIIWEGLGPRLRNALGKMLLALSEFLGENRVLLTIFGDGLTDIADRMGDAGVKMVRESSRHLRDLKVARDGMYAEIVGTTESGERKVTTVVQQAGTRRKTLTAEELKEIERKRKESGKALEQLEATTNKALLDLLSAQHKEFRAAVDEFQKKMQDMTAEDRRKAEELLGRHLEALRTKYAGVLEGPVRRILTEHGVAQTRVTTAHQLTGASLDDLGAALERYNHKMGLTITPEREAKIRKEQLRDAIVEAADATYDAAQDILGFIDVLGQAGTPLDDIVTGVGELATAIGSIAAGDMIGGLQAGLGGIVSVVKGVFFGESASARAVRLALEKTQARLEHHQRTLGDLIEISRPGRQLGAVEAALAGIPFASLPTGGAFANVNDQFLRQQLGKQLLERGMTFADLREVAEAYGLDIEDDKGRLNAQLLQRLFELLRGTEVGFSQTFGGQMERIRAGKEAGTVTDELGEVLELINDPKLGIPAIADALAGIDPKTAEGRAAAIGKLQDVFRLLETPGALTKEALGGATEAEFRALIPMLLSLLGFEPGTGPGSDEPGPTIEEETPPVEVSSDPIPEPEPAGVGAGLPDVDSWDTGIGLWTSMDEHLAGIHEAVTKGLALTTETAADHRRALADQRAGGRGRGALIGHVEQLIVQAGPGDDTRALAARILETVRREWGDELRYARRLKGTESL